MFRGTYSRSALGLVRQSGKITTLIGLLCALSGGAVAADKAPSTLKDEIFARKLLMDSIDSHMDAVDWMLASDKPLDLARAYEHADTISTMLLAFRHLFQPGTNQWKPNTKRDPARDTYASPDLWTNFPDFYRQASAAARIASNAGRAKRAADFRDHMEALRTACNSCHATYVKADE